jgi:hypothetical protein
MLVLVAPLVMCPLWRSLSPGGAVLGRQTGCLVVVELGQVVAGHA